MIAKYALLVTLGLDTIAVAAGLGLAGLPRNRWRTIASTFAMFEAAMPLIGLLVGSRLLPASRWTEAAAALLLVAVGALSIREYFHEEERAASPDLKGARLALAGLSVSLDELAVGFSLGLLRVPVAPAVIYIGAQAFLLTFLGLLIGRRAGHRFEERAELVAGLSLVALGLFFLYLAFR
ncbi:MAG TPA: manganese efflux pump [Chthonomonadales bacterium]|nr:manganese efflux pump [Chthonomonadales bacterium]